ncbi:MAG: diaminopimelate decarboxylase [Proteobacteria bacterium]|nr:diaminopimelate decarboxylase [Pseudomonadota bacterium]
MTEWWEREDLHFRDGVLTFAGRRVDDLARQFGTPTFFYNSRRIVANVERLRSALHEAGLGDRSGIKYAMKANRFAPLLTHLRGTGLVGIDACSPNEVEHAIGCGFSAEDISFTATSLSNRDLERLSRINGLSMNCDSISTIRRWGRLGPGRDIGIRVNPALGISRAQNEKLQYSGVNTTKFGIYREQFAEAVAVAKDFGLTIKKIHFHTGCGYLTAQLGIWDSIIDSCLWFVDQLDSVEVINVGGGLGVPHVAEDAPLDLTRWAGILAGHFRNRPQSIEIEPGDFLAKDTGILLLTINTVEKKMETTFVGVDAGFNLAVEPAVYGLPFHPVPALRLPGDCRTVTIAGNINEALDVWYANIAMPPLEEGQTLALINAGAYSSAMASNHCLRGEFKEFLLT